MIFKTTTNRRLDDAESQVFTNSVSSLAEYNEELAITVAEANVARRKYGA